jgi:hypothetical protein
MPRRHHILVIVLFWVTTSGWLFYKDIWPRLRLDEPPAFTIDLSDEARIGNKSVARVQWNILRGDRSIGRAETTASYSRHDNTFAFISEIKNLKLGRFGFITLTGRDLKNVYRVTTDGALREIIVDATITLEGIGARHSLEFHAAGKVHDQEFVPKGYVFLGGERLDLKLEPLHLSAQASVLNPLHPVNRMTGLRRGQHWQAPLVDPLADSLAAMIQKTPELQPFFKKTVGTTVLQAEVLQETRPLTYNGNEHACLIIEFRGENMTAHTWVRAGDGLVLRQDATVWGDSLVLERE